MKYFYKPLLFLGLVLGMASHVSAQSQTHPFQKKVKHMLPQQTIPTGTENIQGPVPHIEPSFYQAPTYLYQITPATPNTVVDRDWLKKQNYVQVHSWSEEGLPLHIVSTLKTKAIHASSSSSDLFVASLDHLQDMRSILGLEKPREEFQLKHSERDKLGFSHIKLQQMYKGITVFASELLVHYTPQHEIIVNGRYQQTPDLEDISPDILPEMALQTVKQDLARHTFLKTFTDAEKELLEYAAPEMELVIYQVKQPVLQQRLAWHLSIRPNLMDHYDYFVDAKSGEILDHYNHSCTIGPAKGSGVDLAGNTVELELFEAGGNYFLLNINTSMYQHKNDPNHLPLAGDGRIITIDWKHRPVTDPDFTVFESNSPNSWDSAGVSAHHHAELIYQYFENTFGRQSYDGEGSDIVSYVNVANRDGSGMDNASWNGKFILYGNGDEQDNFAAALDVAAHEIGHGVVFSSAGLVYQDQSGALNESFADIFGVMVDRDDYGLGEDIFDVNATYPNGVLRDLSNPNNGFPAGSDPFAPGIGAYQPAHMDHIYEGELDNGGVHVNSGINNKAFHNLATSTSKEKAEQIFYRALTKYLTRSSNFLDCRIAVIQSATDIHGANSAEVQAATAAYDAVGIMNGNSSGPTQDLPINQGPQFIVSSDVNDLDPNTLYISETNATNFQPLTTTQHRKRISVTDDGSVGYFADSTGMIRRINMDAFNPGEQVLFANEGFPPFDNVAVSRDGKNLALVSQFIDTSIYVISFERSQFKVFKLSNPTTAQGVSTGDVLFADAIAWDPTGNFLIYDAFNIVRSTTDDDLEYWDLGLIKVWDNATGNFGDGRIFKLLSNLRPGVNAGNAVFSKNSPNIIAFDLFDTQSNENLIAGMNIETGEVASIATNSILGFPSYSTDDKKLVFNSRLNRQGEIIPVVASMDLAQDKIRAAGNPGSLIEQGRWAEWYAKGQRDSQTGIEDYLALGSFALFPNPVENQMKVEFELIEVAEAKLTVLDILGNRLVEKHLDKRIPGSYDELISVGHLPSGIYLLQLSLGDATQTRKFVRQ